MSKGHSPRPYLASLYGENYDRIFRNDDPVRSLVPGSVRKLVSDCCGDYLKDGRAGELWCFGCGKQCNAKLVEINP
jgi:hypothetical protein